MFVLPSRSGNENSTYNWSTKTTEKLQIDSGAPTFLSNRPGLMRAGSSVSGLFVAINTCDRNVNFGIVVSTKEEGQLITLMLPRGSKPSNWLISSNMVL